MLVVHFACVFLFNIFAIYVTYLLSSVWHAILENFRPAAIWLIDLALFYAITDGRFGESWTRWSWIELAGMATMIAGTAIYNGSVRGGGVDFWEGCQRGRSFQPFAPSHRLLASFRFTFPLAPPL